MNQLTKVFVIAIVCCLCDCSNRRDAEIIVDLHEMSTVALIESLPEWHQAKDFDNDAFNLRLKVLATRDVTEIRSSLRQICYDQEFLDLPDSKKVFLLFRAIFAVPEIAPLEESLLRGGWQDVPVVDGNVNPMWPLHFDQGKFVVIDNYRGYMGVPYRPLDEFDPFLEHYGLRRFSSRKAKEVGATPKNE